MAPEEITYRKAGVDIAAGEAAVQLIKKDVESTYTPGVVGSLGGFAGFFALPPALEEPLLVGAMMAWAPVLLAQEVGRLTSVGIDLVSMSVNDVLTVGARPLFFLDYVAVGRLSPPQMAQIVAGVAEGCRQAECALLGGEMAEMPGLYDPGEFDLAGFCVGLVERRKVIDGSGVEAGDVVLGLASTGFHSNGYSLVRKVIEVSGLSPEDALPAPTTVGGRSGRTNAETPDGRGNPGGSVGELLLEPTRIYVRVCLPCWKPAFRLRPCSYHRRRHEGQSRSRDPEGLSARLDFSEWCVPPLFRAIQELGRVPENDMFATFNMGIGFVLVVPAAAAAEATSKLGEGGETVFRLGAVSVGSPRVVLAGMTTEGSA